MFVEGGLHPEQIRALRQMPLERRAELALSFIRSMRRMKAAALRTNIRTGARNNCVQNCAGSLCMPDLDPVTVFAPHSMRSAHHGLRPARSHQHSTARCDPPTTLTSLCCSMVQPSKHCRGVSRNGLLLSTKGCD